MNYLVARLTGIQPNSSRITNENSTLDDFSRTFPLKHNLYFDFTHDRGHQHHGNFARRWDLTQFLWTTGPPQNHTTWNHCVMVLAKILRSAPVAANRTTNATGSGRRIC